MIKIKQNSETSKKFFSGINKMINCTYKKVLEQIKFS